VSLQVRPARPAEYDRLPTLLVAAYAAVLGPRLSSRYRRELIAVPTRTAHAELLVAVDGPDLLGCVAYLDWPSPLAELAGPGEAEFRYLAVAPWARGRGAGRALVHACLEHARARYRRRLWLFTTRWMTAAQALYTRLGFRRAPYRDRQPRPGMYLICYVHQLP
jgi:ribosomal protein S18 acetylase RimI-like enzyme